MNNTVLIFSISSDKSTYQVCDWLRHLGQKYIVITLETDVRILSVRPDGEFLLSINGVELHSSDIKCTWYRRGEINILPYKIGIPKDTDKSTESLYRGANRFINYELGGTVAHIYHWLRKKPHLDSISTANVNKLVVLDEAMRLGLTIPTWAVLSSKNEVEQFRETVGEIITKPVAGGGYFETDTHYVQVYTEVADDKFISNLQGQFFPTFFQQMVEKEFEIRSFMLNGKLYSMAIFSQQNEQTAVDFRHYDKKRPNRNIPFKLPTEIEDKLITLAKRFGMSTCSFDLIYGKDGTYYFLEVNPVGQFGMTSYPCNYHIEKKIATYLTSPN